MIRRDWLRFLVSLPFWRRSLPSVAVFQSNPGPANAVVEYRKAFQWIETLDQEQQQDFKRQFDLRRNDLPRMAELLRHAEPALACLRRAAALPECRWNEPGDSFTYDDLTTGHFSVFNRILADVACLSAHERILRGEIAQAIDEWFAGLLFVHRVGADGCHLNRMIACAAEMAIIQDIAGELRRIESNGLDQLSRRLEQLPEPDPASRTILQEFDMLSSTLQKRLSSMPAVLTATHWEALKMSEDEVEEIRRITGNDRDALLRLLRNHEPHAVALSRCVDLPADVYPQAVTAFSEQVLPASPLLRGIAGSAIRIRGIVDRMRAFRGLLHAAIVYVRDGESAFRRIADPYSPGGEPFGLSPIESGKVYVSARAPESWPPMRLTLEPA